MTATLTAAEAPAIALEIAICDQRRSYRVTFTGPNAEDMALAFCEARKSTHAPREIEDKLIDERYGRLIDWLYPRCPHGLSESNCYGPQHYYFDEEEQAMGMRNGW